MLKDALEFLFSRGRDAATSVQILPIKPGLPGVKDTVDIAFVDGRPLDLTAALEPYRNAPARAKGLMKATTLASFISLINAYKGDASVIFARTAWPNAGLMAILNYHNAGASGFGDWRVDYRFPFTDDFKAWRNAQTQPMNQEVFAAFLDRYIANLVAPNEQERETFETLFDTRLATPVAILGLAKNLAIRTETRVRNASNPQTGEKALEFSEEQKDEAGQKIAIPGAFIVNLTPFEDAAPMRLPVRLRFRVKDNAVLWSIELFRVDDFLTHAAREALEEAGKATGLPTFEGEPENA